MTKIKIASITCACLAIIMLTSCAGTAQLETTSSNTSNTQSTTLYIPTVSLAAGGEKIASKNQEILAVKAEDLIEATDNTENTTKDTIIRYDKNGRKYSFVNNKLVSFAISDSEYYSSENTNKLSREKLMEICNEVYKVYESGSKYPEKYKTDFYYDNSMSIAEYYYYYNNVRTNDCARIFIDASGCIIAAYFQDYGLFENLNVPEFDKSDIDAKLKNKLAENGGQIDDLSIAPDQLLYDKDTQSFSMKYILKDRNGERTDISISIE